MNLSGSLPRATTTIPFEFAGRAWQAYPCDVIGLAEQLECWVVKFAARKIEALKPTDGDGIEAIAIYQDSKKELQKAIARGEYSALSLEWKRVLFATIEGRRELVLRCVSYREPAFVRELADGLGEEDLTAIADAIYGLTFPPKPERSPAMNTAGERHPSRSTGEE